MKHGILVISLLFSAQSLSQTPASLTLFIQQLNLATNRHDAEYIYANIMHDFKIHRDFGGLYKANASYIENFNTVFTLDNSILRKEYKDLGWQELSQQLTLRKLQVSPYDKNERCQRLVVNSQGIANSVLCFKQNPEQQWRISSFIYGGD
jgi:hypothetical protein